MKHKRPGPCPDLHHHCPPVPVYPGSAAAMTKSGSLRVFGRALARALVLHDVVGHLLAVGQATHAGTLDGRNMDENVRAAVVGLNEAEAIGAVEPLHGTCKIGRASCRASVFQYV